jgi:hypothetical protein
VHTEPNAEYSLLLRQVMSCLIRGLHDPRLQDPGADEIFAWLTSVDRNHIERLLPEATRLASLATCFQPCGGSDVSALIRELDSGKTDS